jgi:hypothetical protein
MTDNIVRLVTGPVGDGVVIEPDNILTHAVGQLDSALVVGEAKDGTLYIAASHGKSDILMLLARAQAKLIAMYED